MRVAKKLLSLLLCIAMLMQFGITANAAGGETNLYADIEATEVEVGQEFYMDIYVSSMTASSIKAGFYFDNTKLEVVDIYWEILYSRAPGARRDTPSAAVSSTSMEQANETGTALGLYAFNNGVDSACKEGAVVYVIFKAIAPGDARITLREESTGTDAFASDDINPVIIKIAGSEPEHTCSLVPVEGKPATCEDAGYEAYYKCSDESCGKLYSDAEGTKEITAPVVIPAKGHGKTNGFRYVHNNGTDTHDVICADCQKTVEEDVACTFEDGSHVCKYACGNETDCADGNNDHKCDVCGTELSKCADKNNDGNHDCDVCGKPGISDCADGNNDHNCDDCGTELSKCADKDNDGNHDCDVCGKPGITKCADKTGDNDHNCDECGKTGITQCAGGTATCQKPAVCSECGKEYGQKNPQNHVGKQTTSYTDNGADHTVTVTCECGGEISSKNEPHNYGDDFICDNCEHELAGWQQKGENWYYVVDGKAVIGATRVPYPTAKINGVTYGPNAEDVAYANANADSKYTDATTAVFIFGEDGKFQQTTGLVDGGKRYAVNGVIAWHVGLVEINGEYYYFIGDVNGGGNIAANGDTYLTRINGIAGFEAKEVYNFENGKFSGLNGLVDRYENGDLYYYENSKLMLGNGLTKLGEEYIYVRSNGQIVVGKQYWVAKTNKICDPGMYTFDENGFMQSAKDPTVNGLVDGIYYKNGMPYYAGLIEIDGDIYYINSAGEAVTGTYYITKIDNYTGSEYKRGDKLTFGTDGKLIIE